MSCKWPGSTGNYLSFATSLFNDNLTYTVMAWIYISTDTNAFSNLCFIGLTGQDLNSDSIQLFSDGTTFDLYGANNSAFSELQGTNLTAATWYHVAMVRSSVTSLTAYLNGVSDIVVTIDITGRQQATTMWLGAWRGAADPLNGRIAAFKAWNTNLTISEVQQEMRQFMPVRTTNLYMFTPFTDSSTGTDFLDYSGNGRNWSETGAITFEDGPPIPWRQERKRFYSVAAGAAVRRLILGPRS